MRWPLAEPLSGADVAHWQAMTASTWHLLVARHRMRAEALAYGLRAITPLLSGRHDLAASTTTRSASWAIALTPPNRADRYACGLIHELEHSTLNELQELVPLIRHGQGKRFYSPWCNDPRPGVGLLHGVHAWISVTEFCCAASSLGIRTTEDCPSTGRAAERSCASNGILGGHRAVDGCW